MDIIGVFKTYRQINLQSKILANSNLRGSLKIISPKLNCKKVIILDEAWRLLSISIQDGMQEQSIYLNQLDYYKLLDFILSIFNQKSESCDINTIKLFFRLTYEFNFGHLNSNDFNSFFLLYK